MTLSKPKIHSCCRICFFFLLVTATLEVVAVGRGMLVGGVFGEEVDGWGFASVGEVMGDDWVGGSWAVGPLDGGKPPKGSGITSRTMPQFSSPSRHTSESAVTRRCWIQSKSV